MVAKHFKRPLMYFLTGTLLLTIFSGFSWAASKDKIDAEVKACLVKFNQELPVAVELENKASGYLVFPSVVKAGLGIGGEYGEGALLVGGTSVDYYSTASGSIGFQLGVQSKSIIIMFMTQAALDQFRNSKGWKVGVDGSVALVKIGAGDSIDSSTINDPVIGFIFGQTGLMYNLTLEGSKITKLKK